MPALLERMRKAVDEQLWQTGGLPLLIYSKAKGAWIRQLEKKAQFVDKVWLSDGASGGVSSHPQKDDRAEAEGADLRLGAAGDRYATLLHDARGSGAAGLRPDRNDRHLHHGRSRTTSRRAALDPAIPGIEMKLAENEEIVVRGPNIFPGYWDRPQESAKVLRDGWFHTGDQGEVDANGNWRIIGRIKNLIILGFRTQHCTGADRREDSSGVADRRPGGVGRKWTRLSVRNHYRKD